MGKKFIEIDTPLVEATIPHWIVHAKEKCKKDDGKEKSKKGREK